MDITILNETRKKKGLSIEQLAERANLPKSTVEKILFGIVKNPRVDTMQAIEEALGLSSPKLQLTAEEIAQGIVPNYKETLSSDEIEVLDAYRAIKDEKGEKAAEAIKLLLETYLNYKK